MADKILAQELTQRELMGLLVYCEVTGVFRWRVSQNGVRVGDVAGTVSSTKGYRVVKINGKRYYAHRLAWRYVHGVWPSAQIDHIDRDRTNNRIANLREATSAENNRNRSKCRDNTSGHVGVRWREGLQKWQADIGHLGRLIYLGFYDDKVDALAARKTGEMKYWGAYRAE